MEFVSYYIVIAILKIASVFGSNNCTKISARQVHAYNDKKISQSVMWTLNNGTKFDCLQACDKEKYCVSFHFRLNERTCIALRERFEGVTVVSQTSPRLMLYQMDKALPVAGSDCELDSDCAPMKNSHCRDGKCACDIGFGMEVTLCRNLTECTNFSDSFTRYVGNAIYGNNVHSDTDQTVDSCQQMCFDYPGCLSAEVSMISYKCWLHTNSWYGVPSSWHGSNEPHYVFFQRECSW